MSTKETNKVASVAAGGSDNPQPVCGPNEHFDEATGQCVPNSGAQEVSAFSETAAAADSSAEK